MPSHTSASSTSSADEAGMLPSLDSVVRVAESRHRFELLACSIRRADKTRLPSEQREPAGHIAENLLVLAWAEFTNPMVLATYLYVSACAYT